MCTSCLKREKEQKVAKIMYDITRNIQTTFSSNLEIRALYLYTRYVCMSTNIKHNNYLDVGCGYGVNSSIFGQDFNAISCIDLNVNNLNECRRRNAARNIKKSFFTRGDVQSLPFKPECFDLVSAFSVIEHVRDKREMLGELLRVLTKDGELVLQFPNKYFFVELHTGLPFYFIVPTFIKQWFLRKIGYENLLEINIPTPSEVKAMIEDLSVSVAIRKSKVIYPIETIPHELRWLYTILKKFKVLNLVPMGWLLCVRKK